MHGERYPQRIQNFDGWYAERLREIKDAERPEQVERSLQIIREYSDAKWCFAHRYSDANALAAKVRKANGWGLKTFSEGEAA